MKHTDGQNDLDAAEGLAPPAGCRECDRLQADALDGVLSPDDQAHFDAHLAGCTRCADHMAEAQRGVAWLEMLRFPRPEPGAELLGRILAETSGAGLPGVLTIPPVAPQSPGFGADLLPVTPLAVPGSTLPFPPSPRAVPYAWRRMARSMGDALGEPRLAMTAAMAFFSIALTMSLTGVKLAQVQAAALHPSTVRRSLHEAQAGVVRYYDNLRVVHVMEARVATVRQGLDAERDPGSDAAPDNGVRQPGHEQLPQRAVPARPRQQTAPAERRGTSRLTRPLLQPGAALDARLTPPALQQAGPLDLSAHGSSAAARAAAEGGPA